MENRRYYDDFFSLILYNGRMVRNWSMKLGISHSYVCKGCRGEFGCYGKGYPPLIYIRFKVTKFALLDSSANAIKRV